MAIVSRAEFADFLGKSPSWVSKQIAGGLPVARYGENGFPHEIDSAEAFAWLLDSGNAQGRLKRAQAEKAEAVNAERIGRLIPIEDHQVMREEFVVQLAGSLSAMPARCAEEFATIRDPALMRARLQEETDAIRNELADRAELEADRLDSLVEASQGKTSS